MGTRTLIIAAALAATTAAAPASAAAVPAAKDATGKALILVPLTLTKIDDLSFGTVIPSGTSGTVSIDPNTGLRTYSGGISGGAIGNVALFAGAGSPNAMVVTVVNAATALTNGNGDTIQVVTMPQDGSPIRTIDPISHTFFVKVGGVLNIAANQPEGDYVGTFSVTANYF